MDVGTRLGRGARLAVLLLALGACARTAAPADEIPPLPSMEEAKDVRTRHLDLVVAGQRAGALTLRVGRLADGGWLLESATSMTVTLRSGGDGESFRTEERQVDRYAADRTLLASSAVKTENGASTREQVVYREGAAEYRVVGPEGTFEGRIPIPEGNSDDLRVLHDLMGEWKEGVTGHRSYRSLDLDDRRFETNEVWLEGKTSYERAGARYPAWKFRMRSDEVDAEMVVDDDQIPFELTAMGGLLRARWVDEPAAVEGAGWSMTPYVPVDVGVPDMLKLDSLELRVRVDPPPADGEEDPFEDNEYQSVERLPDGYRLVLRHRRPPVDFLPAPLPVATDDPEVRRYLAPTPQSQCDHPDVAALARRLTEGAAESLAAVRRIVRWVWANVEKRSGTRGAASAVEVLKSGRGDCTEHAALTVALCRAAGIPARSVGGIEYLVADGKPFAGYHAWAEAWVGRWVPIDATIPQVGTSARYILLGVDEPGEKDSRARTILIVAKRIRLEVLAWRHLGRERVEAHAVAGGK